jgi:hypothetical protein
VCWLLGCVACDIQLRRLSSVFRVNSLGCYVSFHWQPSSQMGNSFALFFLHFSLCALWYNCYKIRPTKCTHFTVLIYKMPTCFGPHRPIIRECSCTKLLLGHTVICNIRNCGENVSVWYTEVNMYTTIIKY